MNKRRVLPSVEKLQDMFLYDSSTGRLIWKKRPVSYFKSEWSARSWNTKYSGNPAGCVDKNGAILINIGRSVYAHRIVFKMMTGQEPSHIDHINGNPADNRIDNLRVADDRSNGWNTNVTKDNTSGFKNVYFDKNLKNKPWFVSVHRNRTAYYGGHFKSKEQAHLVACRMRRILHGEFVRS